MNNRHDILQRLSSFMDLLSPEAKAAFARDIDGVVSYAGGGITHQTKSSVAYDLANQNTGLADLVYAAISHQFRNLTIADELASTKCGALDKRRIALFGGWAVSRFGDEIEQALSALEAPTQADYQTILVHVAEVVKPQLDVEAKSKAELKLKGGLPPGLSVDDVQHIVAVIPFVPAIRLALTHAPVRPTRASEPPVMGKLLKQHSQDIALLCRVVALVHSQIRDIVAVRWTYCVLACNHALPEFLPLAALALDTKNAPSSPHLSNYAEAIQVSISLLEAMAESLLEHGTDQDRFAERNIAGELAAISSLGFVLSNYVVVSVYKPWMKRLGAVCAELAPLLEHRLGSSQDKVLRVFASAKDSTVTEEEIELLCGYLTEFHIISDRKDMFAFNTKIPFIQTRYEKAMELGLERLLERAGEFAKAEKSEITANFLIRVNACLRLTEAFFQSDYANLMRKRFERELNQKL